MATVSESRPRVKPAFAASLTLTINAVRYDVTPIPPGGFGTAAWRLVKADAAGEAVYDLVRDHFGIVECTCPHYEFVLKGNCVDMCKHGRALVALGLLDAPEPTDVPHDAWEDFDGFTVECGPDPDDRDWHDAQGREHTADDFPTPRPGATQPTPPAMTEDDDEAYRA
jgi:hypothetical protein